MDSDIYMRRVSKYLKATPEKGLVPDIFFMSKLIHIVAVQIKTQTTTMGQQQPLPWYLTPSHTAFQYIPELAS